MLRKLARVLALMLSIFSIHSAHAYDATKLHNINCKIKLDDAFEISLVFALSSPPSDMKVATGVMLPARGTMPALMARLVTNVSKEEVLKSMVSKSIKFGPHKAEAVILREASQQDILDHLILSGEYRATMTTGSSTKTVVISLRSTLSSEFDSKLLFTQSKREFVGPALITAGDKVIDGGSSSEADMGFARQMRCTNVFTDINL